MRKKRVLPKMNINIESDEASDTSVEALANSLIKAIVDTRHEKGLLQEQIQNASGVPQSGIYRLERRVCDPKLTTMIRVLRPMGMTLAVVPISEKPQ